MTITITPSAPSSRVGIGLPITLQSDFVGPLPTGTRWQVGVYVGSDAPENLVWGESFGTGTVGPYQAYIGVASLGLVQTPQKFPAEGGSVLVDVSLFSTSTLDTGSLAATWSIANGSWWAAWRHYNDLIFATPSASNVNAILNAVRAHYVNAP